MCFILNQYYQFRRQNWTGKLILSCGRSIRSKTARKRAWSDSADHYPLLSRLCQARKLLIRPKESLPDNSDNALCTLLNLTWNLMLHTCDNCGSILQIIRSHCLRYQSHSIASSTFVVLRLASEQLLHSGTSMCSRAVAGTWAV